MNKILRYFGGIVLSLTIISSICLFVANFNNLYYLSVDKLNIQKISNISKDELILNYDYMVDYIFSNDNEEFELPTIKSSREGKIHFEEVRDIVKVLKIIFGVMSILSIIFIYISFKTKDFNMFKISSNMMLIIPIVLSIPIIIDFDTSFTIFHEILFDNDYWIFDPNLDPVINILPQEFFMYCGIMILGLIFITSMIIKFIYKRKVDSI